MAPTVLVEYMQQKESKKRQRDLSFTMMGKTQRFSQGGYSSGFVPDYRHVVETMGESEGFGSCGRIDTEMAASEDSCTPKGKCISLNVDRGDGLNVPLQVISLSRLSRSERKELEVRLRSELEQVRFFQQKIASRSINVLTVSSSGDIGGYSDGHKRPNAENFGRSVELSSGQGKKKPPPGGRNGPPSKQGHPTVNQAIPSSNANAMLLKQCETLLKRLMSHQHGWVFNTPVDVVKLNIPDYFTIIKHPMDLGTIQSKIASGAYSSPRGFAGDVRLTFSNAMTYNPPGNDVHAMADTLSKFFEMRWKPIEKKLPVNEPQLVTAKSVGSREKEAVHKPPSKSKKNKAPPMNCKVKAEVMKRKMTNEEKQSLSRDLESLQGDMPERIIDFLRGHSYNSNQTSEDEIEVDIDALSDDTLFTLRKLLDDYLQEKKTSQAKTEPCEMELLNESGLSNSSMRPCKGNDLAEEDVDIGGNDPPVSSYPPIEIEKDTVHRSTKCSSSSNSSSDSGSSSSDSDSGSSSGGESDGAKVLSPAGNSKETLHFGAAVDRERSDPADLGTASGVDQLDQNTHPVPVAAEKDNQQEGENAPSERHVSPEKLYRAAYLRNRFADTILKAREKTLHQGEKGDPDKLRREREELERQQREEKARLLAEAKAAEEARKQAEAEAAAEAKRKRELERQAARLALQKMEKTVEINENCQFLKDLEMLGSAPERLPSSVDETSPDHTHDGLGSFKLRGSNPLEQLGLYMKVDDEEEEECEPDSARPNDVEEGEID
ncbi:hypothetical protein MRB53_004461 [Persea americana]|uniref:Uncharacterized protein n=1 Tax=Persea americana TaxID=3435 RepID=A0ACC2MAU2_PERAE|nr:hypothetical protein MRB53_004461 [Persea americana]|eukprot:TRINITY_DN945_c0_g2_i1.p1 TRINITY_DN945_c0_g2~~TRINITY_DN945_c0_g2_i1.p1  ORF type:complete len:774 (-),score=232.59 TRINITY_DN945_c0_g2_i1:672-2993(-)